jgi:hypothetical protein
VSDKELAEKEVASEPEITITLTATQLGDLIGACNFLIAKANTIQLESRVPRLQRTERVLETALTVLCNTGGTPVRVV